MKEDLTVFTGIIEELGTVKSLENKGVVSQLCLLAPKIAQDGEPGQSICVNGACLTITERHKDLLKFEVMSETLKRTSLGLLKPGHKVNLEKALRADGRLDGHFVTGHIDGTGIVKSKTQDKEAIMVIQAPAPLLSQIALKGSVALDGVSLTVSNQQANSFAVHLLPYTLKNTTLRLKKEQDMVNIECDILAKYIGRFLAKNSPSAGSKITPSFLQKHGFTP